MTTAQVVEKSVTVNNNSLIQDYVHLDNQTQPTFILFSILTITSEDHCRELQDDLDGIEKWKVTWRMEFNDT